MSNTRPSNDDLHPDIPRVRSALLEYFDAVAGRRELPWRENDGDPYRIWVSEVMLQQTRAETVAPYYRRWLRRFPDLDALADAPEDDVLKQWEGLGYYRRARHLHQAARVVRERYHGRLPEDPAELKKLPGIGDYTAGAVASIAFGVSAPAVDGNTRRVLCRLYDLGDPSPSELRRLADSLVPVDRPGDFNQALMELGATVCKPRAPACETCPVSGECTARAKGTQMERPHGRTRGAIPHFDIATAVVLRSDGRLLLTRRPAHGLLAGLWEFPGATVASGETPTAAADRAARRALAAAFGPDESRRRAPAAESGEGRGDATRAETRRAAAEADGNRPALPSEPLGTVSHTFSHRRHTYHAFRIRRADLGPGAPGGECAGADKGLEAVWTERRELAKFAIPSAQRRIIALLEPGRGKRPE